MSLYRMQRILHIFVRLFFLLAVIFGVWIAVYAYNEGFTKKWRNLIMQEFEKRGIDAEIEKLTIDPFQGLVARNVRIYADEKNKPLLASIDNITLDIDPIKLLRKKQSLNSVEFRNADISIPINPGNPESKKLEIKDLRAKIIIPTDIIEIKYFEGHVNGIRINVMGSLLLSQQRQNNIISPSLPEEKITFIKEGRELIDQALDEITQLDFKKKNPPHIQIKFASDLDNLSTTSAIVVINAKDVKRGGYKYKKIYANAEYNNSNINLKEFRIDDSKGTLFGDANWSINSKKIPFNIKSTIDFQSLISSFGNSPLLNDITFINSPQIEARGELHLGNLERPTGHDTKLQIELIGTFKSGSFISKEILFEEAYADFSYRKNKLYARNLILQHATGTANGNILWNTLSDIQFETEINMDPTVFVPFFKQPPKFLKNLNFEENPTVHLTLKGKGATTNPIDLEAKGYFALGPCHYQQIPLTAATGKIQIDEKEIIIEEFRVDREEGYINGESAIIQTANGLVDLKNISGKIFPSTLAAYFSPNIASVLDHYKFVDPPELEINGIIDTKKNNQSNLKVKFNSKGQAYANLFKKKIPLDQPKGSVLLKGKEITLNIETKILEGQISHKGLWEMKKEPNLYSGEIIASNINFGSLVKQFELPTKTKGILSSNLQFKIPLKEPTKWSGSGSASLIKGNIFSIPILGPLSPMISGVLDQPRAGYSIAQSATINFFSDNGIIKILNFQALTPGFILNGKGTIDGVNDTLDLEAEMNARGPLRLVGWPISKLLRYKGEGTLKEPKWKPINFSIPLNIIANGEKLIKESKVNDIIPEAINILPNAINKSLKAIEALALPGISPKKK
ncbi:AsmA-like C-terminal region-containing protein [Verrucomicrobia bacterium]|nr:AsmA-like C-terminal region-containing protein [Verrucomicrobiota bacterium]